MPSPGSPTDAAVTDTPPCAVSGVSTAPPLLEDLAESHGLVVVLVAGAEDERDAATVGQSEEMPDLILTIPEFRSVAATELVPAVWIVDEPLPEFGARGHVAQPLVDLGPIARDASRPHSVDQHAVPVVAGRRVVRSPDPDA